MLCYYHPYLILLIFFFFFFNDTATTEIYTLSLHDALPIFEPELVREACKRWPGRIAVGIEDRKSTRLNSSHANMSYAVFCLKKKKKIESGKLRRPFDGHDDVITSPEFTP